MTEEEKKKLSADLKLQSENAFALSFVQNQIDANSALSEKYLAQMKQPLDIINNPQYNENYNMTARIGDFAHPVLIKQLSAKPQENLKSSHLHQPKDILKRKDFKVVTPDAPDYIESAMAYYQPKDKTIRLQKRPALTPEQEARNAQTGFQSQTEYCKWNVFATTAKLLHEATHKKHKDDGQLTLKKPIDIVKADQLTEKIAYTTENLYIAHQYALLKKEGMDYVEINDKKQPVENILDMYPGLKEAVMEHDFDINNKKDVERVVQLSSDFWDKNRAKAYGVQHLNSIVTARPENLIQYCMHDDAQYDTVAQKMLKDTYIGNNTNVDLSEYRHILDNMTTDKAKEFLANVEIQEYGSRELTYGQIENVNNYLESINLKTEEEKMGYLQQNFDKIVSRTQPYDEKLKQIMMEGSSQNQNTIVYADGLTEKITPDGHTVIKGAEGEADITAYHQILKTSLGNAQALQQHQLATEISKAQAVLPPQQEPTKQENQSDLIFAYSQNQR